MFRKLKCSENDAHQCWTYKNKVGTHERLIRLLDYNFIDQQIIGTLPVCKVADKAMFEVCQFPCPKYSYMHKEW
jgi:hypothetical protein